MRQLRVVGLGDDHETVILEDPIRLERFAITGDERLRAAARGDVRRLGQMEIAVTSELRPRDIQARVRAGESVEEVAAHGGVTTAHVERFAYPVLLERARVAEISRRAHPHVSDGSGRLDARSLGEIVAATLAARGQDHEDARWDAVKGEDGQWVAILAWQAGRSDNVARWTFRPGPSGGTVAARDDAARELLGEDPLAARRAAAETTEAPYGEARPEEEPPALIEAPALAVSGDTTPARHAGHPGHHGQAGARRPAPSAPKGRGASLSAREGREARDNRDSRGPRGGRAAVPGEQVPGPRAGGRGDAAPSPAAPPSAPPAPATEPAVDPEPTTDTARGRGRRSHPIVPSWEDVLLGTRSPRD
jgi:hypothetical protein